MARPAMLAFIAGVLYVSAGGPFTFLFRGGAVALAILVALLRVGRFYFLGAVILFAFSFGMVRAVHGPISFAYLDPLMFYLGEFRDMFSLKLSRALPEPHASYLGGLLVGARSQIPFEVYEAFRKTGTSHLVALSGYNVTIIVSYLGKIFSSLWFPIVGILFFTLATGAQSSLVRAALMGVLALAARGFGHEYAAGNALGAAVVLMLFFDPTLLLGDIGFQLSIAATAGLIYFSPGIARFLGRVPQVWGLRENLSLTLAAQLATLPILFYYFGTVSFVAPITNVLVLMVIPLTMLFGFFVGIAGFIHPVLAALFAQPTWLLLTYQLSVIQFFANAPTNFL